MSKIKQVLAREILNAKGNPALETTVILSDGKSGTASCPSGTSAGSYEACELLDNDEKRYGGKGVLKAIDNVNSIISPALVGVEVTRQPEIDKIMLELDGTQNKGKLGANAILSVSMACCKAAAKSSVLPLFLYIREYVKKEKLELKVPTPLFNVLNGGLHADMNLDFQEFMIIPASSKSFEASLQMGTQVYNTLKKLLKTSNQSTLVGDEGGFSPRLAANADALSLLKQAINDSPYKFGFDIFLGMDVAASSFYQQKKYVVRDKSMPLSSDDLISLYKDLSKEYSFLYLEDPLAEDDWEGWVQISKEMSLQTIIVGDDLTVTNPYRLQMALNKKAITGIIIKPNQIGTVIETLAVVEIAREAGLKIIVSHRSGETNDDFIADLAVAVSADYAKFGAPARGERVAKYNRLLQIEKQLSSI
jgi:enolase